jgi:hypothetical protein
MINPEARASSGEMITEAPTEAFGKVNVCADEAFAAIEGRSFGE